MNARRLLTAGAGAAAVLGPAAYLLFFRSRCLNWGARADEVAAKLPGDELLADAGLVTTRAVTIHAPAGGIWPWLAQMGSASGAPSTVSTVSTTSTSKPVTACAAAA
jgi:hypothetical protein